MKGFREFRGYLTRPVFDSERGTFVEIAVAHSFVAAEAGRSEVYATNGRAAEPAAEPEHHAADPDRPVTRTDPALDVQDLLPEGAPIRSPEPAARPIERAADEPIERILAGG